MNPEITPAVGHGDGVAATHYVVFLDTSIDTHLAMIVSDSDTVSDFKRKIVLEHRQLFPSIGDIKVECVKVKRKGSFYHMSDSMLVKSAFSSAKGNWFVSVDASHLEQNDGTQQLGKHNAGDQLALPWVTHNHGSPSVQSKASPFMNKKTLIVDQLTSGDSCKDVLKNVEEDGLFNDKKLDYELKEKQDTVNKEINLKKRTRDVHNEGSLNDAFGSGPSVIKKRKTRRGKSNVKTAEENLSLTHDINDKVNGDGAGVNNDNYFDHISKGKDLSDENKRINEGEICSALDQVATVVPTIEGVGSETVGDVEMVVENNVQQDMSIGMSQMDKDSELFQQPAMENEIPYSLTRTPDCEHGGAAVTATGHMKRSTKYKSAAKEVSSTSFNKNPHVTNKDVIESSPQQDVGSNSQECAVDQIDKYKEDSEISLKQKPELKLPPRKKGTTGCEDIGEGKRRKTKKRFKHPDSLVGDISSTVLAPVADERKMNEVLEKTLIDVKKGDDVIVKEVEMSVENTEEKSRKEFIDANDVATVTDAENLLLLSESLMNNDAEISTTGKSTSQVNIQGMLDISEKQNEKTDDTTKKKKKRKTRKSAGRNEEESMPKNVDGDVCENVKEGDRKHGDEVKEKDAQISYEDLAGKENKNNESQDLQVELESKKSQIVDHHHLPEKTSKNVTASEISKVNNEVDISENESRELDFTDYFAPGHQPKKIVSTDDRKDMKKTKVDSRKDQSQKLASKTENNKVSVDVLKDPNINNIDKFKTPKWTKKTDAQKTNGQQSTLVRTRVTTAVDKKLNGPKVKSKVKPKVKRLLNTPGTIFGDDSDSDSSTSGKSSSSSSSSSSGEVSFSQHSRRSRSQARKGNQGAGKDNANSKSDLKKPSISDLLRSSSSFKKSKVTVSSRVEDTESQHVDVVPESQP